MELDETGMFPRHWPDLGRKPGPAAFCSVCRGARRLPSFLWRPVGCRLCLHCFFRFPR